MPSLSVVPRLLLAIVLIASPVRADDDCSTAGRKLASSAGTCLEAISVKDACVQQALSVYSKAVRKLPGGCTNAGKELHACLKGCTGDKKVECLKACTGTIAPGGTAAPAGNGSSPVAPPAMIPEDLPPRAGFVTVRGHWYRMDERWEWAKGRYEPAREGQLWLDGRWEMVGGAWQYLDGTWNALPE